MWHQRCCLAVRTNTQTDKHTKSVDVTCIQTQTDSKSQIMRLFDSQSLTQKTETKKYRRKTHIQDDTQTRHLNLLSQADLHTDLHKKQTHISTYKVQTQSYTQTYILKRAQAHRPNIQIRDRHSCKNRHRNSHTHKQIQNRIERKQMQNHIDTQTDPASHRHRRQIQNRSYTGNRFSITCILSVILFAEHLSRIRSSSM